MLNSENNQSWNNSSTFLWFLVNAFILGNKTIVIENEQIYGSIEWNYLWFCICIYITNDSDFIQPIFKYSSMRGGGVNTLDTITNRSTEDNISSSHVAVLIVCIENVPLTAYKTIHLQQ